MPPAVAAVAAGVLAGTANIIGITTFVIAGVGLTVSSVVFGVVVTGLSLLSSALGPKFNAEDIGTQVNMARDPSAPREYIYGRTRTGGTMLMIDTTGTSNETLWINNAYADHEVDAFEAFYLDDETVSFDGAGNATTSPYNGFLSRYVQTGSESQAAISQMISALQSWTVNHRNRGMATVAWKLTFDPDVWPGGLPNLSVVIRGRKIYDPRLDSTVAGGSGTHRAGDPATWTWSQNPVLCLLDYMRDDLLGPAIPFGAFDMPNLIASANICDELVSTKDGGLIKRYTINGIINSQLSHGDVIELMTRSMAGTLTYSGGVFRVHPGTYSNTTSSFDEDDILSLEYTPAPSRRELVNAAKGRFADTSQAYQPADYPPQTNAAYETQDGGERFWLDLDLVFTHDHREAQRIAKLALESARHGGVAAMRVNLKGLAVRAWDTVTVTHENYGWSNKVFRVIGWKLNPPSGESDDNQGFTVDLSLKEESSAIYAWNPASDEGDYVADPGNVSMVTLDLSAPTGLTATAVTFNGNDGSRQPAIKVTWDPPPVWVIGVQVELSPDNGATWYPYGVVPPNSGDGAIITGLVRGTTYRVRIAHVVGGFANVGTFGTTATSGSITITASTIARTIVNQGNLAVLDQVNTAQITDNAVTENELVTGSTVSLTEGGTTTVWDLNVTAPVGYDVFVMFLAKISGTGFGDRTFFDNKITRTDTTPDETVMSQRGNPILRDETTGMQITLPFLDPAISDADPTYRWELISSEGGWTGTIVDRRALVLVIKR
ncbi:MAG: phage tail protein [Alphaproteobacteria bacterium]